MEKVTFGTVLAVGIGGGIGSVLRFLIEQSLPTTAFPWIALAINISACLALGVFMGLTAKPTQFPESLRAGISIGLLGSFAAFSDFVLAANRFLETDHWIMMAAYLAGSVFLGLLAIGLGLKFAAARRRSAVQ